MRAIDKQDKNFTKYFQKCLILSLRKMNHFVTRYYSEGDFNKNAEDLSKVMGNHFSLVGVLRNCDFYPEDYSFLNEHLLLIYTELGMAVYPDVYFAPLKNYLEKYKEIAPFEDYLNENPNQLSFNFN